MIDWTSIGAAIGWVLTGIGTWVLGRRQRARDETRGEAAAVAELEVITLLRDEIRRLGDRVQRLEQREGRLVRHMYRLDGMLRTAGIEPPHFDLEASSEP